MGEADSEGEAVFPQHLASVFPQPRSLLPFLLLLLLLLLVLSVGQTGQTSAAGRNGRRAGGQAGGRRPPLVPSCRARPVGRSVGRSALNNGQQLIAAAAAAVALDVSE